MNADPLPISLSTQMRPPCISMNFLVIDRPRPVPPYSEAMVASVCLNSVNRLPIVPAGYRSQCRRRSSAVARSAAGPRFRLCPP